MLSERVIGIASSLDSTTVCDDVRHCRTLPSIVLSCASTMFLCTWVALHPNVPKDPYDPWYIRSGKRVGLMIVALLAPEAILTWAFWDWIISSYILVEVLGELDRTDSLQSVQRADDVHQTAIPEVTGRKHMHSC